MPAFIRGIVWVTCGGYAIDPPDDRMTERMRVVPDDVAQHRRLATINRSASFTVQNHRSCGWPGAHRLDQPVQLKDPPARAGQDGLGS
jgi:hypothetical protein